MGNNQETKREDAFLLIRTFAKQRPESELEKGLSYEAGVDIFIQKIRNIMGWSGISVSDARNVLNGLEAPHKKDMLDALERIEQEQ